MQPLGHGGERGTTARRRRLDHDLEQLARRIGHGVLQPRDQRGREPAEPLEVEAPPVERGEHRGRGLVALREQLAQPIGGEDGDVGARGSVARELRAQDPAEHVERGGTDVRRARGRGDLRDKPTNGLPGRTARSIQPTSPQRSSSSARNSAGASQGRDNRTASATPHSRLSSAASRSTRYRQRAKSAGRLRSASARTARRSPASASLSSANSSAAMSSSTCAAGRSAPATAPAIAGRSSSNSSPSASSVAGSAI